MFKVLGVILSVALLSCVNSGKSKPAIKTVYETYVELGQLLPISTLNSYQGETVSVDKIGQRKLVILFATWCSDSQRAFTQILASDLVNDRNLQIVGIGREENTKALAKFKQDYKVTFPLVADPGRAIYKQFANAGIPRIILVDEQNRIVKTIIGEMPRAIDEIVWPQTVK